MKDVQTDRRRFFKQSMLLGGGLLAPAFMKADRKDRRRRDDDLQIVGHGDFQYRVDKEWGVQDLNRVPINNCHEMVEDSQGRLIMVTDHPANNVIFYSKDGRVTNTWTLNMIGAHGLTLSEEGGEEFLYITDSEMNRVVKTTLDGRVILDLSVPLESGLYSEASEWKPTEVCVAPTGDFYVADGYGKNYILQYNQRGELIHHFGGKGEEDDQFDCCHGITLDTRSGKDPVLLITSRGQNAFKRFTMDGKHLETIHLPGCWICRPVIKHNMLHFAVIVTRSWWNYDGMLAILDEDNKVVSFPGGSEPIYDANGILQAPLYDGKSLLSPHDVCVDRDGHLYVPQWLSGKTYPVKFERIN